MLLLQARNNNEMCALDTGKLNLDEVDNQFDE